MDLKNRLERSSHFLCFFGGVDINTILLRGKKCSYFLKTFILHEISFHYRNYQNLSPLVFIENPFDGLPFVFFALQMWERETGVRLNKECDKNI